MTETGKAGPTDMKRQTFKANSLIFDEGQPGDFVYIIRSGEVEIRKGYHSTNPQTVAKLGKGEIFGEVALFDDSPRMASVVAMTDVDAILMSREAFRKRVDAMDPAIKTIVLSLVAKTRQMGEDMVSRKAGVNWANWDK